MATAAFPSTSSNFALSNSIKSLFEPWNCPRFQAVPSGDLVRFNPRTQFSQLHRTSSRKPGLHMDHTSLVLYVSAACRGTGSRTARASYGLYFGPSSLYNTSGLLDPSLPQTIACAEVEALAAAIDMVAYVTLRYAKFTTVKLVTDSQYLVDAMVTCAPGSPRHGDVKTQLRLPAHSDRLMELRKKIQALEYEDGVSCQLWHMAEDANAEAGTLAIEALSQE